MYQSGGYLGCGGGLLSKVWGVTYVCSVIPLECLLRLKSTREGCFNLGCCDAPCVADPLSETPQFYDVTF